MQAHQTLEALGHPARDAYDLPASPDRFPDGGQYRVEIPSVEGPEALDVVLTEATGRGVPVHRVSQGSGIMMQTDGEMRAMLASAEHYGTEVCLFTGPRAAWDTGVQVTASSGRLSSGSLRGADQLAYALEDVSHGCGLGLRSVLVSDLGHLMVLGRAKEHGYLPADLVLKVSIQLPVANPATARVCQDLGANSLNLPADLSMPSIAAIRAAVDIPVDVYVEAADDFGGTVRHYEIAELVRVAAPVYVKFTVRNAPGIYPAGAHLQGVVLATAAERVRRARIGLDILHRYLPEAVASPWGGNASEQLATTPGGSV